MWLSSIELMKITGMSRATLNNYIKYGLIPKPVIKRPDNIEKERAKRIGYFPKNVLDRIEKIKGLKKSGYKMRDVINQLNIQGDELNYQNIPAESKKKGMTSDQEISEFIKSQITKIFIMQLFLKEMEKSSSSNLSLDDYIELMLKIWHSLQQTFESLDSIQSDT
jgi:DNA-binding transcriptional MerR regulator